MISVCAMQAVDYIPRPADFSSIHNLNQTTPKTPFHSQTPEFEILRRRRPLGSHELFPSLDKLVCHDIAEVLQIAQPLFQSLNGCSARALWMGLDKALFACRKANSPKVWILTFILFSDG